MKTKDEITLQNLEKIYHQPLLELIFKAQEVHRLHHEPSEIQASSLINIKSGGCQEDCAYCSQSIHNNSKLKVQGLMPLDEVLNLARTAKKQGASRVCLGAAWREIRNNRDFDKVLTMVGALSSENLEVCCTLGMLNEEQAIKLKEAGLTAYNHNLDSSENFYDKIISTRDYQDRIDTLKAARSAGISLCSGGIIGMGEEIEDRLQMLLTLNSMDPAPESIPINLLVPIEGTKLSDTPQATVWELIRMIATARILIPKSTIRLSAGREKISTEGQALCFLAGANSIFLGERLLTTDNCSVEKDLDLFAALGLKMKEGMRN